MNQKKAKALRRLAAKYSNPNVANILETVVQKIHGVTEKHGNKPQTKKILMYHYANGSARKIYLQFKKLYTRNMLPEYFLNRIA